MNLSARVDRPWVPRSVWPMLLGVALLASGCDNLGTCDEAKARTLIVNGEGQMLAVEDPSLGAEFTRFPGASLGQISTAIAAVMPRSQP